MANDIQSLIQSLVPSSVNNGNPNTVYNNPTVPTTDANGSWYIPQVNPAANMAALNLQLGGWVPPAGTGSSGFSRPVINFGGMGATNPNWPGSGTGGGGGGGTTTPGTPTGGGGGGPLGGVENVIDRLGGGSTPPGGGLEWNVYGGYNPYGNITGTGGGTTIGGGLGGNSGSLVNNPGNGLWDFLPGLAAELGMNTGGGFSWQQLLDLITEPFMPGDYWNSQTGDFNWTALGESILGIPGIGDMLRKQAEAKLLDDNPSNDNDFIVRLYKRQLENKNAKENNLLKAQANNIMTKTSRELVNSMDWGINPAIVDLNVRDIPARVPTVTVGDMINANTGAIIPYAGGFTGSTTGTFYDTSSGGTISDLLSAINGGTEYTGPNAPNGGAASGGSGSSSSSPAAGAQSAAALAGGGQSQGGGIGYGWTGVSGDAARGIFSGMAKASSDAIKQAEYMKWVKSQAR